MACINNDPLDDEAIDSVLNQTASADVLKHLENCPHCASLVREVAQLDTALKTSLYRGDCPSSLELAEYHANMLEDSQMIARIQHHLTFCSQCNDELKSVDSFMRLSDNDSADTNDKLSKLNTDKILKPNFTPIPNNIMKLDVGVDEPLRVLRGRSTGPIMLTAQNGMTLFVEVNTEVDAHTLTGQIVTDDTDVWVNAQVQVFQSKLLVAIAFVEELGDFTCKIKDTKPLTIRINNKQGKSIVVTDIQWSEV